MMKHLRDFTLISFVFILVMFFQNCGQENIDLRSIAPPAVIQAEINLTAKACVNSLTLASEKTKFIFVIDLSLSNIGDFYTGKYLFNGTYLDGYSFFDAKLGTDVLGARFDSISQFINTCGNSSRPDYAIIGFSKAAGEVVKIGPNNTLVCTNQFVNSGSILAQLNLMKQIQTTETPFYTKVKEPSSPWLTANVTETLTFLYKETNYVAATDCISSTIAADLALATSDTSNYQVFFLSDGEAKAPSTGCEAKTVIDKVACYTQKMDIKLNYLMKLSAAKSKPIRIHSLYYTRSGAQNLAIEAYMNYLSSIGQTVSPINLGVFQSTTDTLDNPFCKLLAVDKSIVYRTNKIFAVNLNTLKSGALLKKDFDADGIPDDEEILFGSELNNPRSLAAGVLDGICKIIGSKQLCIQARSQITCDKTKINAFNISDCDIKVLRLDEMAVIPSLAGIDTDNDGVPDYVEILKGTSPINNDSYLDFDGDGLTSMQEISMGLDPFTPDALDKPIVSSASYFNEQIEGCTSGGWELNINSLGGNPGLNNLMFFFRTESKNTQGVFEYRAMTTSYLVNKSSDQIIDIVSNQNYIGINDFRLVTTP